MIEVTHFYGVHQGGTKDYHLYLFTSEKTRQHILIKRWGKTGSDGQSKIEIGPGYGRDAFDRALKERTTKGYDMRNQHGGREASVREALEKYLPRSILRSLSNAQVAVLDSDHGGGKTGAYDPLASQRSEVLDQMQKAAEQERLKKIAEEQASADAALKSNPMYGMF